MLYSSTGDLFRAAAAKVSDNDTPVHAHGGIIGPVMASNSPTTTSGSTSRPSSPIASATNGGRQITLLGRDSCGYNLTIFSRQ